MSFFRKLIGEQRSIFDNPAVSLSSLANPGAWLLDFAGGSTTEAGVVVTPTTALECSTVVSCVRLVSEGIAQLPIQVVERLDRGYRVATEHPYYDMLRNSWNDDMSSTVAMTVSLVHCLLYGASYTELQRDNGGRIVAMWPRMPTRTSVKRDNTGKLFYEHFDGSDGRGRKIEAADMIFVPGLSLDGLCGVQTVSYARQIIGIALALDKHAARYFGNGMSTTGTVEVPGELSDKAYSRMRESMERQASGANRFRALILEAGVKFQQINSQNDQGQFIQTRTNVEEAICSMFRCPIYLINSGAGKGVRSNSEAISVEFRVFTLNPWIVKYQSEWNRKLFNNIGRNANKFEVQMHVRSLMAADSAARMTFYQNGRNSGILTANECRVWEGLEPVGPEGDLLMVPLNTIPASQLLAEQTIPDPLAAKADMDEDEDRSLQANVVKRLIAVYSPLLNDAFSRLNNRSKRDMASISQCLKPALEAASASLREMLSLQHRIGLSEEASNKAIDKFLASVEARGAESLDVPPLISRAIKALTHSAHQDLAIAMSQIQLTEAINESE